MPNEPVDLQAPTQKEIDDAFEPYASFPAGIVMLWYAKNGRVPNGWAACDGSNGTPDLRGQFLRGVGSFSDVGEHDGSETHNHHYSGLTSGEANGRFRNPPPETADNGGSRNWFHQHTYEGHTDTKNHLPPYYTVLFIMRLTR
ncbi:MAG: hypothetical protein AAF842_01930 [Planctomycetota bacterium]